MKFSKEFERFFNFLNEEVSPIAHLIDEDSKRLQKVFNQMIDYKMIGISLPQALGGLNLDSTQRYFFYRNIAATSGALMLLQTQYQSVLGSIYTHAPDSFDKTKWLNDACLGKYRIGIGISHLHNTKLKLVTGIDMGDHYQVSGKIKYVTGYNYFNYTSLGFVIDEYEYMGLIPFTKNKSLHDLEKLNLIAASSTNTVSFTLDKYNIPKEMIFYKKPIGYFHEDSIRRHILVAILLGIALSILKLISSSPLLSNPHVKHTYQKLHHKFIIYEETLINMEPDTIVAPFRVEVHYFIRDCLTLAEQLFRGAITKKEHPLNRLKNEFSLFQVLGAENEILNATINKLDHIY